MKKQASNHVRRFFQKIGMSSAVLVALTVLVSTAAQAQTRSLPLGKWDSNANGFVGNLTIQSVDSGGNLTGTYSAKAIKGFWDENSKKITFYRFQNPSDPSTMQIFTGYLFRNGSTDFTYTLTGFWEAFQGSGATAKRTVYGWFARIFVLG